MIRIPLKHKIPIRGNSIYIPWSGSHRNIKYQSEGIVLCFYEILIMECIYYSLWLVLYVSMGSWSCNVYTIPSDWYFMFLWDPDHVGYILFPLIGFYVSMGSWTCNVYTIPSDWFYQSEGIVYTLHGQDPIEIWNTNQRE
jgi:hypothetical protein